MTEITLRGDYDHADVHHVATNFSRSGSEMRTFQVRKVVHLVALICRIAAARIRHRGQALYYTPTPVGRLPLARDVAVLLATRWMFPRTIFHFHAGGTAALLTRGRSAVRLLGWLAYRRPDVAIRLSVLAPEDGKATRARSEYVIPNPTPSLVPVRLPRSAPPVVLYVGLLSEEKGLFRLLEVTRRLCEAGVDFRTHLVGDFASSDTRVRSEAFIAQHALQELVEISGVLTGADKSACYAEASVFCFLTDYEAEVYPLVVLEATQAGLPIVASCWRGIPDMVAEGSNAVLVEPHDTERATQALHALLTDDRQRDAMAAASRQRAATHFTAARYWRSLDRVFEALRRA